jgi:hypothetical protein
MVRKVLHSSSLHGMGDLQLKYPASFIRVDFTKYGENTEVQYGILYKTYRNNENHGMLR